MKDHSKENQIEQTPEAKETSNLYNKGGLNFNDFFKVFSIHDLQSQNKDVNEKEV